MTRINLLPHNHQFLTNLKERTSKNIIGKGENTVNQHYLLFPQYFLPKGENAGNQHILLSPHCFLLYVISIFISHFFCHLQMKLIWTILNPFPNKPWFLRVCSTSLLKTLREKEKLSNFSSSHCVFYPFGKLSANSLNLKLLSANSFILEESKICCLEKGKILLFDIELCPLYIAHGSCYTCMPVTVETPNFIEFETQQ